MYNEKIKTMYNEKIETEQESSYIRTILNCHNVIGQIESRISIVLGSPEEIDGISNLEKELEPSAQSLLSRELKGLAKHLEQLKNRIIL